MLHEAQRTSAPRALSVSMRTAVWMVMWSEPAIRAPARGFRAANSSRMAMRAGISPSAMAISLRPHSASDRSATRKSAEVGLLVAVLMNGLLCVWAGRQKREGARTGFRASAVFVAEPDRALRPDATLLSSSIVPGEGGRPNGARRACPGPEWTRKTGEDGACLSDGSEVPVLDARQVETPGGEPLAELDHRGTEHAPLLSRGRSA